MAKKSGKNNPARRFFLSIILLLLLVLTIYFIKSKYLTQDSKQSIAFVPITGLTSITLNSGSCLGQASPLFKSATYYCNGRAIQRSYDSPSCADASTFANHAASICSKVITTIPPNSPITPTPQPFNPSPTPNISQKCAPNAYIAGTYCTSTSSCYDIYCNTNGSGTKDTIYGASTCSFCASYTCSPSSFIAGTYFDNIRGQSYDIYCNSSGNGTVKRYY